MSILSPIDLLIQSTLIMLALILLRPALKKFLSPNIRCALWALPAARLLLPFKITSPTSILGAAKPVINAIDTAAATPVIVPPQAALPPNLGTGGANVELGTVIVSPEVELGNISLPSAVTPTADVLSLGDVLLWVWLAGVIVTAALIFWANMRFFVGIKRLGTPCPVKNCPLKVYLLEALPTPCLSGVFEPRIVLNSRAFKNESVLDMTIRHELCHYRRRDHIWGLVRGVITALYWFDPLVWLCGELFRQDCETACDAAVTRDMTPAERESYGLALIDLATADRNAGTLVCFSTMSGGKKLLRERIKELSKNRRAVKLAAVMGLLIAAVLVFTMCTSPADPTDPNKDTPLISHDPYANIHWEPVEPSLDRYAARVEQKLDELGAPKNTGSLTFESLALYDEFMGEPILGWLDGNTYLNRSSFDSIPAAEGLQSIKLSLNRNFGGTLQRLRTDAEYRVDNMKITVLALIYSTEADLENEDNYDEMYRVDYIKNATEAEPMVVQEGGEYLQAILVKDDVVYVVMVESSNGTGSSAAFHEALRGTLQTFRNTGVSDTSQPSASGDNYENIKWEPVDPSLDRYAHRIEKNLDEMGIPDEAHSLTFNTLEAQDKFMGKTILGWLMDNTYLDSTKFGAIPIEEGMQAIKLSFKRNDQNELESVRCRAEYWMDNMTITVNAYIYGTEAELKDDISSEDKYRLNFINRAGEDEPVVIEESQSPDGSGSLYASFAKDDILYTVNIGAQSPYADMDNCRSALDSILQTFSTVETLGVPNQTETFKEPEGFEIPYTPTDRFDRIKWEPLEPAAGQYDGIIKENLAENDLPAYSNNLKFNSLAEFDQFVGHPMFGWLDKNTDLQKTYFGGITIDKTIQGAQLILKRDPDGRLERICGHTTFLVDDVTISISAFMYSDPVDMVNYDALDKIRIRYLYSTDENYPVLIEEDHIRTMYTVTISFVKNNVLYHISAMAGTGFSDLDTVYNALDTTLQTFEN